MTVWEMDNQNTTGFDPLAWLGQQDTTDGKSSQPVDTPNQQSSACQPLSPAEELAKAMAVGQELARRGCSIADDYRDYLKLGFALANGLGCEGRSLYHMLCSMSPKYRAADCEQKWQECMHKADGRTSIATYYHMARQAGIDISAVAKEVRKDFYYSH